MKKKFKANKKVIKSSKCPTKKPKTKLAKKPRNIFIAWLNSF
jgi:hypothetical protein